MSHSKHRQKTSFHLEGVLLQFVNKPGHRPKMLWLATADGEYQIKLAKSTGLQPPVLPQPGDWIELMGQRTVDKRTGKTKLKANRLQPLAVRGADLFPACATPPVKLVSPAKVLVCQKSTCQARGAQAIQCAIAANLQERGLAGQVQIKATGCMGSCKKGPNIVFMPDKTRYQQVTPAEIPALVTQHIVAKVASPIPTAAAC